MDDLEKVLSHLSYLKIDQQAGALKTSTRKTSVFIFRFVRMFLVYGNMSSESFLFLTKKSTQSDF